MTGSHGDLGHLDVFHDLLPALARGLDVRDIFQQLSAIGAHIVPHDAASLALLTDEPDRFHLYTSTGTGYEVVCRDDIGTTVEANEPRILEHVSGSEDGMQSGLTVPVTINDHVFGVFGLLSRRPHAYSDRDLVHAQRLATYLALALSNQRLVEHARGAALERERTANVETSVELLRTIADVLDIRSIFPRVSEIANKALPHDAMTLSFFDDGDQIAFEARTPGFPDLKSGTLKSAVASEEIIDDLEALPPAAVPEPVLHKQVLAAGYRSMLYVRAQARDQVMYVNFFCKRRGAFTRQDLPIARRITDHIALAVSHEQLAEAARQVAEARARADRLEARVQMLTEELDSKTHCRVVGESAEWKDSLKKATQVAATDTTVLLTGDSGTGKEVVARFIHRASGRRNGPFVALNCAALPEQLLESELFGYERGAFTSAQQSKPGQIELAAGGVLFLDEVSEMSLSAQAKFLRVLQEREFQRLGGTKMLKANIRVIAATNRDLRKAVERSNFREDLFYRLQVFDIHIAPLRERRADILPLSEVFLGEIGKSFGRPPAGLTREARQALLNYDWPGNVRELRNSLERAAIVCEGGLIHGQHLGLTAASKPTTDLNVFERETIARVLAETQWNKVRAAKRLGLSRTQLYGRMRKYGLEGPALDR